MKNFSDLPTDGPAQPYPDDVQPRERRVCNDDVQPQRQLVLDARHTGRRRFLAATSALAAGVLAGAGPSHAFAASTRPATVRIGFQKYGTLVILKARGTLEKRLAPLGVTVKWLEFPAGPQLLEGLNAGAIDIGTVGETPPIFAQAAGVDFVYIGNEPQSPRSEAIVVPHDSPLTGLGGLRGKRVALNKGSNVHYLLVRALQQANLKYSDISPVYLAPADARAAFVQGSLDAWVIWDPFFAAAQKQAGGRVLRDGAGLVNNLQFYLAARRFAHEQPGIVHALLDEIATVDAWGQANAASVAQFLAPQTGIDVATLDIAAKRYAYGVQAITDSTLAYQQNIADTFALLGLIPKKLDVRQARWEV